MRMSIAFLVWTFPKLSETFILNEITGLLDRGEKVHIYALSGPPVLPSKIHPDVERYHLLERTFYAPKLPANYFVRVLKGIGLVLANVFRAPLIVFGSLNVFQYGKQAASLRLLYATIPLLEKEPYDIIHCQFGTIGQYGMALRRLGVIEGKLVTSFRGYDISREVKEHGDKFYVGLFATGDLFFTNCEYFKRRLVSLGCDEKKLLVHASGIDCERFFFAPNGRQPKGPIRIVTTGRLIQKKGIEYGIRAIAKLAKRYPTIEYRIIGEGPLMNHLRDLAQQLAVDSKVELLGARNQSEIIEILANSDIFVGPSVTPRSGNEDAPINTLKEAMAMGRPVIGTRHGGIPELIQDGVSGFLVPERDADAIAEKLVYLIEHPHDAAEMGRAGRKYVEEHYNLAKLNNQLVTVYRRLLNRNVEPLASRPDAPLHHVVVGDSRPGKRSNVREGVSLKDSPIRKPVATIVVVPREGFSLTRDSLESIYQHTECPFSLVYVDGGSPRSVQRYLEAQARKKGFQLIRTDYYLSPNRARNLGLGQVSTKYVVFMDNDVMVTSRWLTELVQCAEETGAAIVSPLICQGRPVHETIHCAGGESGVYEETDGQNLKRHIIEKIYRQGQKLAEVQDQLHRQPTGLAEFHCMMVRREVLEQTGHLDDGLLNTKEHVDLCITVAQAGGVIYFEPKSVVTYVYGRLKPVDIAYYVLRWSDAWELASLHRLRDKWNLTEDDYFARRYKNLGWRRQVAITSPLSRCLALGRRSQRLHQILVKVEKMLNQRLTNRYARNLASLGRCEPGNSRVQSA